MNSVADAQLGSYIQCTGHGDHAYTDVDGHNDDGKTRTRLQEGEWNSRRRDKRI